MTYKKLEGMFATAKLFTLNRRLLSATIAVIICCTIGGSVYAYTHTVTPGTATFSVRKANSKTEKTAQTQIKTETPTVDTTQTSASQPQTPITGTVPEKHLRRKADSTNPEWAACVTAQNQQYVAYQVENTRKNSEKAAALVEVDRRYTTGELRYDENGVYRGSSEEYTVWQMYRSTATQRYDTQLIAIYTAYNTKQVAQQAVCDATYDH